MKVPLIFSLLNKGPDIVLATMLPTKFMKDEQSLKKIEKKKDSCLKLDKKT